jgi:hypothetical protein
MEADMTRNTIKSMRDIRIIEIIRIICLYSAAALSFIHIVRKYRKSY